jgi:hypothetical protein
MAAVRLLNEPGLRERIVGEARLLAEQSYDWRGLGDQQEAVLRDVVERSRASRTVIDGRPGTDLNQDR